MPATIENSSTSTTTEVSPDRLDSTFTYDPAEMDKPRVAQSSEHLRSTDSRSGLGASSLGLTCQTPGIRLAMKRTSSESVRHRDSSCSNVSINEQTQLLIQKMFILEKKLQSMESQLKTEQVQRLSLEAKVVKLERDNEQLKSSRAQAGLQLQNFAELFYTETETIKLSSSCTPSPHPSLAELRRSRTDSLSSNSSLHSQGSRFSHVSM